MGFDVSWHPISQKEMFRWYFDRLEEVQTGDHSGLVALAKEYRLGGDHGNEKFCADRYQEVMDTAAKVQPEEVFDKTHSYILAAVQGLFRTYYYTRGGLYSNLMDQPAMAAYTLPFQKILGKRLKNPIQNRILDNYSGGVYIPEDQVPRLLAEGQSGSVRRALESTFGNTLPVFFKALEHARREGLGLLEATEIIEPNPLNVQETVCRSYLNNCDFDGVAIYVETCRKQLDEAIRAQGGAPATAQVTREVHQAEAPAAPEEPPKKRTGLLKKLFGGNK
ncbi:MAG: hypothetical protein HFF17_16470 [Oscillospiraceae bacterium]|nr:hypothetical protein [Oscillospiraceae bacterium]